MDTVDTVKARNLYNKDHSYYTEAKYATHVLNNNKRPVFTWIKVKKKSQVPDNLLNPEQV